MAYTKSTLGSAYGSNHHNRLSMRGRCFDAAAYFIRDRPGLTGSSRRIF